MAENRYALEMIESFYEEGDRDWIFLNQIIGAVSYDDQDMPFKKTAEQIAKDMYRLVEYFVSSGDFELGRMEATNATDFHFIPYSAGFTEFRCIADDIINKNGLKDDYLNYGVRLRKICQGACPPALIQDISDLFR